MCGIVGYVGPRPSQDILIAGLARLEYRGYDSAGVAVIGEDGTLGMRKRAGKLSVLRDDLTAHALPDGTTGIGHTRWATHGGPTDANAHPHLADDDKLAVIHNGIIENFAALKADLLSDGYTFRSETDTEVAAVLLGREYRATGDLVEAFRATVAKLDGAFTLLAMHQDQPGLVVGARRNSPLVIGLGEGENFLGSDVAAFVEHTRHALAIGQDEIVAITPEGVTVTDFHGEPVEVEPFEVTWDASAAEKGGWSSFMAKEVSEEPEAVANTLRGRIRHGAVEIPELDGLDELFASVSRIVVIACGTAAYAGQVGKYALEKWANVPVEVELSHEFRYRDPVLDANTLVVSISQSGETMDTLMAVKYARERGAKTLSICNTQGATIPRESDAIVYTHAGPEVAVASTKAFTAQITALYLLALHVARVRGSLSPTEIAQHVLELEAIPEKIQRVLDREHDRTTQLARWMADTRSVLFLGRNVGYPIALEGALKLKEISYIHAEGFAAGELKHGPIALIEPGQPVFVLVPSPRGSSVIHDKVVSNIQEIRARGARVIVIAEEGDAAVLPFADEVLHIPLAGPLFEPLLAVVPLHIFAMGLASAKGLDVDQPRNLAKSVTVE
ncbi:MAG: glutamine--fructose-6-phosphate transaminase (isomerizing) [Microbacterium sp.]|jgi:glucosamine--fructose-6-phosphate aminotransferase (isomerizing)|uniref:Glutamine--fructose-6-phosphate aminotransferase [isomerizing] n=1 Tax=Microbacterium ginsengisoli TaxID=400772 RepID=A0A0F0LZM3_9MICO|nr:MULTISPECIES: glutamine--fructose-6-phosphate transaminase (isomerizing) [Microbacterium]MAL07742.1 glutamine--fructose-6-phosphate transaminase (isomerizing) [Microbacterium sp.]MCK9913167.1 glutamine--fructose-6-phosphate transaminase (isomerizing) [Microbacteriaceae bacterium K1510]KJL38818.1 Glutamine--fructose-6-phosphate aminotransferase [isomerizing] [Microbacterium ginsengisoli]KQS02612.1 glutamine amidotransferase [Microbacterium sp. Leaf347]KQS05996.1 glutamine amidotransferase [M